MPSAGSTTGTGAHPKTSPPNFGSGGIVSGYGAPPGTPGKATSALDAPLTEAQIATLPPALQAVLRKKQAEQGITPLQTSAPAGAPTAPTAPTALEPPGPGVSAGFVGAPALSAVAPVAPAADELTPEQRAVLAQIRALDER